MNKIKNYFFSSLKRDIFKKIKCDFCNTRFPDEIQQRLHKFRFMIHVECPKCGAHLDIYDC